MRKRSPLLSISSQIHDPILSDWIAVERNGISIPWDLERTSLQIKTNSALGSSDELYVDMLNKDGTSIGAVAVWFKYNSTTVQYKLLHCTATAENGTWTTLPVQPPVEVGKIWTISKTETALTIACNNVEVLYYQFKDSSDSNCVTKLGGDFVEQIKFPSWDDASDFYRAEGRVFCKRCLDLETIFTFLVITHPFIGRMASS